MKFTFRYNNKKYSLDVKECKSVLSKATGLMFRRKSPVLLFYFNPPVNISFHSFFCTRFIIIFFNNNKIIHIEDIQPYRISIKPSLKYDKVLEIPINNPLYNKLSTEISHRRQKGL